MSDDTFFRGLQELANSVGKPIGNTFANMSSAMFGEDDPDTKFYRWLAENKTRLREASSDLGIEVQEGDGFIHRLREAYIRKLEE